MDKQEEARLLQSGVVRSMEELATIKELAAAGSFANAKMNCTGCHYGNIERAPNGKEASRALRETLSKLDNTLSNAVRVINRFDKSISRAAAEALKYERSLERLIDRLMTEGENVEDFSGLFDNVK